MISYMVSVAQICVFLDSMIVNDLLQSLGRPNMCLKENENFQITLTL